jgi:uncharacterized protein YfaS (alpha-2-macroglobulin family)
MRAALLFVALAACGQSSKSEIQVSSYSPQGSVDSAESITIRFDKPVVPETMVAKEPGNVIAVKPEFAYKAYWFDRKTLVIDPVGKLASSTKYSVALVGALGKQSGNFKLDFVHDPLVVEGVWGVDADMLSPDGSLPISFNQPVQIDSAAKHCKLAGSEGEIGLISTTTAEPATQVSLAMAKKLTPGGEYTLTCEGLTGAGGNTPMAKPYSLTVHVRPLLGVTSMMPAGVDVPADEATLVFTFSTPVTLDVVRKAITSRPRIKNLSEGFLSGDGTEYKVTTDLDTETDYKITIGKMTDTFGQELAKPVVHEFRTGNALPRLSMERGIFAVEASAKGYPVWSRNVGKFDLECAAIPKERIVNVLTTDMNYDPWGGNNDDQPIDWKTLKVKAKKSTHKTAGKNKWRLNELELGTLCGGDQRGVFLAEVRSDEVQPNSNGWWQPRRNRVLANVTDMGVLIKTGVSSGLVWVTSLSTGEPVAGAKVTVFTPQGKAAFTDVTNADGLIRTPGSAVMKGQKPAANPDEEEYADWDSYRAQRMIAVVEKAGDMAIVDGNWSNGIQLWNFGVKEDRLGGVTKIRGFIQSDRGLYRPGEEVHFKGLAREIVTGRSPRVPVKTAVAIEIQDSRGEVVSKQKTKLSDFGGFAWDLKLGEEAALGDYYVNATVADQVFREKFTVEEFRPASFEVKLKSRKENPRPGERLTFELETKYLFGSPNANAKVEWGLRKREHQIRFPGFEMYSFSSNPRAWWWYERNDDYGEFIADGDGETNAQGKLVVAARDSATKFEGPVDYILSANVTDASDQTMGKSVVVTAHKTAFYLGVHANEYVQAVGMPFGVNVVALDPAGKQVATKAKLSFIQTKNSCNWTDMGPRGTWSCTSKDFNMEEREIDLAAAGSHTERIFPKEPGDYVVKVEAKDAAGNAVVTASELWVIGKGEAFWSGDEGDRMSLVASKQTYVPGETARLVAMSNIHKPTALITVERDGIIDARVKKLDSAAEGVELVIADAWAPNVFASVALVSGRHGEGDKNRPMFKMGIAELKVSSAHKELAVGITLDKAEVRPGEKVSGKIRVTQAGAPVKAEVSLSAADEGVLQLISYETPNPMKTFYAVFGLGVDAGTNWNRVARLADPEAGDPDIGGDAASSLTGQRIRSKFVSSAFWAPMLVTDDNGEIAFSFTAPDNLTAFRLMAVAADVTDRFGAGELRLTVNKPLMAAPALPRFLRSGDAVSVGMVLHNNTPNAGTATVTAMASGVTMSNVRQTVQVPANGSTRVRFGAKASEAERAIFQFSVTMGKETDDVKVAIPIERPRVIERRTIVEKALHDGEEWKGTLDIGADVLRRESRLVVTVDKTGLGELGPSLRSLVEYPYGCLEQTMSKFVPLVAAKDIAKSLDDAALQGTRAQQFIRAGVQKVMRHQQADGNFSLWPQSQTYPHLTAYALWGLTVAEKAGEKVPASVFDNGIAALQTWSQSAVKPDGEGATVAMAAYVMALRGKADSALNARLYAIRTGLPKWGQAFLLRALKLSKAPQEQVYELEKIVSSGVTVTGSSALVKETSSAYEYGHYMNSDVRATAMTLAALVEVNPNSALIDPLVAGLKAQRDKGGAWSTTQENLWSLVALAEYGRKGAKGDATVTITSGGKQIGKKKITNSEIFTMQLPLGAADDLAIKVDHGAHVSARVTEARVDAGKSVSAGFTLERTYTDTAGKPITTVKAGEIVKVHLTLSASEARKWVALVDPLPAGFEAINDKLAAGGTATNGQTAKDPDDWQTRRQHWINAVTWDHQEMRDDRVLWFADNMAAGNYELEYEVRATIDGTFAVMPATIEAMYAPEVRARTATSTFTVTK